MPMDQTDHSLIKGAAFFAVLAAIIYFFPFTWPIKGYSTQTEELEDLKHRLEGVKVDYVKHFKEPHPGVWQVRAQTDPANASEEDHRTKIVRRITEYKNEIDRIQKMIAQKKDETKISFAAWTKVPEKELNFGAYFMTKWKQVMAEMKKQILFANVNLDDEELGFEDLDGDLRMPREKAEEYLRQLYIAETIVRLCIEAKNAQLDYERKEGLRPEASMKIIAVDREQSIPTGPFKKERNPLYKKDDTNPRSKHFNKYLVKELPKFIQEYPILIRLQCDVNSFMRFLYSVRTKGHFLVIRHLRIDSPYMILSQRDKQEFEIWQNREAIEANGVEANLIANPTPEKIDLLKNIRKTVNESEKNLIWVEMSAAGMDFFDPEKVRSLHGTEGKERLINPNRTRTTGRRPVAPKGL